MTSLYYLTTEQVLELHEQALMAHGGAPGIRALSLLASAIEMPKQSAFGADAYATMGEKAAAYAYFLAKNHPFIDGNKRVAGAAMLTFLFGNQHRVDATSAEIDGAIRAMVVNEMSKEAFFAWCQARVASEI